MRIPFLIVAAALFCLLITACKSSKHTVRVSDKQLKIDSSVSRETIKLDTIKVKRETTALQLPTSSLKNKMIQESTNGRAKVVVKIEHDTLYAEAICDSLEHIIFSKNKEILYYRYLLNEQAKDSREVKVKVPFMLWVLVILSVAAIICFVAFNFLKRFKII